MVNEPLRERCDQGRCCKCRNTEQPLQRKGGRQKSTVEDFSLNYRSVDTKARKSGEKRDEHGGEANEPDIARRQLSCDHCARRHLQRQREQPAAGGPTHAAKTLYREGVR